MNGLFVVFPEAFDKLDADEKIMVQARLNDPLIHKFFRLQQEAARNHATTLNPNTFSDTQALEYLNKARSFKLVEFFWQELEAFSKTWSTKARSQGG